MSCFDENAYIKKCPICNNKLEIDDIDYNFDGNQNEISICEHCHISFEFFIRYHHLWKYIMTPNNVNNIGDSKTIYVWKGGKQ